MPLCSFYVIFATNLVTDLLYFEDKELSTIEKIHGAEDKHLSDYRQPLDITAILEE